MCHYSQSFGSRYLFIKFGLLSLILLGAFLPTASAQSSYTYTGNSFNLFNNYVCPPECNVAGSFTVSGALGTNLNLAPISPSSFSFTDGTNTWSSANVNVLSDLLISTDATGNIDGWVLGYYNLGSPGIPVLLSENQGNIPCGTGCLAIDESLFGVGNPSYALVFNNPGSWSVATTPEPASIMLFGTGLAVILRMRRRRRDVPAA